MLTPVACIFFSITIFSFTEYFFGCYLIYIRFDFLNYNNADAKKKVKEPLYLKNHNKSIINKLLTYLILKKRCSPLIKNLLLSNMYLAVSD